MRHVIGATATAMVAALTIVAMPLAGTPQRAQPGSMFNPAATLDTTQVRDRRDTPCTLAKAPGSVILCPTD